MFSALARLKAGMSDSGWRQFNRQYAELVPFPIAIIEDENVVKKLASLADKITAVQGKSIGHSTEGAQTGQRVVLEALWQQLDEMVEAVYGLTKAQKKVLDNYPRRVNRFDLLFRQSSVEDEGDS